MTTETSTPNALLMAAEAESRSLFQEQYGHGFEVREAIATPIQLPDGGWVLVTYASGTGWFYTFCNEDGGLRGMFPTRDLALFCLEQRMGGAQ